MNAQEFGLKPGQELFEGDYRTKMAELREAGCTPWSTKNWMDARNGVKQDHPFWNNYGDTDFGIAGSKRKIHLMPHSARLRAVTPETILVDGGLSVVQEETLVKTYTRSDLILGRDLTEKEAHDSQVWLDFAAGNKKLLDKYVVNAFRFGKDKCGYDKMMGIFVPEDEVERGVVLDRLGNRSRADGNDLLSNFVTRFVGVRSEGVGEQEAPAGRDAQKVSPYRKDPRSDLEVFLSQHEISREDLPKAVELYKAVKQLKL